MLKWMVLGENWLMWGCNKKQFVLKKNPSTHNVISSETSAMDRHF